MMAGFLRRKHYASRQPSVARMSRTEHILRKESSPMPFPVRTQSQGHRGAARASCKVLSRRHDRSRSRRSLRQGRGARRDPQKHSRAERVLRGKRRVSHDQSNSRYPCRSKAAARRVDPCCAVSRSHNCINSNLNQVISIQKTNRHRRHQPARNNTSLLHGAAANSQSVSSVLRRSQNSRLIVQNDIGQQFRSHCKVSVVVNQSHCPEFVHEVRDARTRCANHFGEGLMTQERDSGIRRDVVLA